MKRIMWIIIGSYASLLATIGVLSWLLYRERHRRVIPVPEALEGVFDQVSDLASRAEQAAASINSMVSRRVGEARTVAHWARKAVS